MTLRKGLKQDQKPSQSDFLKVHVQLGFLVQSSGEMQNIYHINFLSHKS